MDDAQKIDFSKIRTSENGNPTPENHENSGKTGGFEVLGKEAVIHSCKACLHRPRPRKHANPPR